MALGKLLKGGSLVLAGVLIGGLLSYNSKKTEIVTGINDISNMAIVYKTQAKELSTSNADLTASLESAQETVRELTESVTRLENEKVSLEAQLKELVSQGNADATEIANLKAQIESKNQTIANLEKSLESSNKEITRLNGLIKFKDTLFQTTYEKAIELENKVEDLTKQLEEAKKDSKNIVDEANEQIKQANQDQVDILDAVNQAKEKINNN